ncbi:hypothetical protein FRZ67_07610 [Panacibacter ginsenosidivorans]|uniref:Uncharacterized protein n=1 Tax=Panacibacter ginsenosidivorans TaxID=1813871 RepID=A0A5B8V7M6_9BACT|nr:hypothetical protein [Panacibacter ginsenosidivorans]QEC67165.1 hypothetical protein FRZ67_07610 [Panacibacter ginsenosidivorans]
MKLRFENKSIRFRIRKSELQHLKQHGFVKDEVAFPNEVLTYELRITDISEITPAFSDNKITIHLPIIKANDWLDTDEVGIYKLIHINADEVLDIVIEKDFPCKDRPEEDKSDTFTELVDKDSKGKVC